RYALHEDNFTQLAKGALDMLASAWLPHSHGVYKERVEQWVATRELGLHYQPYALWGVPDYVPASDVSSIDDLTKPEVLQRINTAIHGIGAGAGITRFSLRIMAEYGLQAAGYRFYTGTQESCTQAYEQLVNQQQWGVVPLWHPQFLHHRHRIRELHDPKGLLGGVDRAVLLAREDRLALFSEQQIQVLDSIRLSNAIVAELDYATNRLGLGADQAAADWLQRHPDYLARWLAPLQQAPQPAPPSPEQRLAAAGLSLPSPPAALGHYVPWAIVGNTLMTSGQFPWLDGELQYHGRLGRELDLPQAYAACRLAALNAIAQLKDALGDLGRVKQIYRLEGVMNVADDFHDHPKALDGASDLLAEVFAERGRHTRMIWSNPVMPMDGFCLVYLFAEIEPAAA
ncbi:MAG: Atu1372/SO_1960 family protein, partial [Pseudomonas sp.]